MQLLNPVQFGPLFFTIFTSFICFAGATEKKFELGSWKVSSTGSECVSTGWLQEVYAKKNGDIFKAKIQFSTNKMRWSASHCKTSEVAIDSTPFTYFDSRECRTYPGTLPKSCAEEMKTSNGKPLSFVKVDCPISASLPNQFWILSSRKLLALVDGDYICLETAN